MQHLVWKLLDFRYRRLLITTNAIKFWVGLFKSTNTTPQIMPNFYSITSTYIELDELGENWAALSYEFPKANTIRFQHPFCTPASPIFPYFTSMTILQRWFISFPYLHNHFPNKAWLNLHKFRTPKTPNFNSLQTWAHSTRWNLEASPIPLLKKSLWSFSMRLAFSTRIGKSERK